MNIAASPLTPALSPSEGERENRIQPRLQMCVRICQTRVRKSQTHRNTLPLRSFGGRGEGRGEVWVGVRINGLRRHLS